jgi:uncharacterized damage-inducible protein DinB
MSNKSLLIRSALSIIILSGLVFADDHHQEKAPMAGFCGEFIGQIDFIQGRLMQLQQAVPADKFVWQPADGVRSLGDVYMHAALANYYFVKMSGQEVPKDINIDLKPHEWDKTATGKVEISKVLERSFNDLKAAAKNISEADLEKTVKAFGMEMSLRNLMVSSLNHLHEHLGQSIAYARSNGVTPPWTLEQQQQHKASK